MTIKKILVIWMVLLMLSGGILPAFAVVNGIFLGSDENGVNILNDKLRPGEEYYFPVLLAVDGAPPTQLTAADLERNRLEARIVTGGKALASVTVEQRGGLGYLCVTVGSRGTVQELSASLRLNYRSRDTGENLTVTPAMKIGYPTMPIALVEALEPGAFLETDNSAPIITASQFQALASLNEHREVTLSGAGWRFTVNVSGLGKRNLVVEHAAVMDLVKQLPDHQLHFIAFPGEPDFEVKGKMQLDVSALAEEYNEDFFLYRCAYGKLYPLSYEFDREAMEISFRPSQLSTYLISDKKIPLTDNTPTQPGSGSEAPPPPMENPNTGDPFSGRAPALAAAVLSLSALGALVLRRR